MSAERPSDLVRASSYDSSHASSDVDTEDPEEEFFEAQEEFSPHEDSRSHNLSASVPHSINVDELDPAPSASPRTAGSGPHVEFKLQLPPDSPIDSAMDSHRSDRSGSSSDYDSDPGDADRPAAEAPSNMRPDPAQPVPSPSAAASLAAAAPMSASTLELTRRALPQPPSHSSRPSLSSNPLAQSTPAASRPPPPLPPRPGAQTPTSHASSVPAASVATPSPAPLPSSSPAPAPSAHRPLPVPAPSAVAAFPKHAAPAADDEDEEDSGVFVPSGASAAAPPAGAVGSAAYPSSLEDPAMLALNMRIKNLDTGETCDISDLDAVFPQTMTIDTFKRQKKAKQPVKPSELGAAETEEERTQKRSALGFIARVKRAFAGGGGSLKAGVQPNVVKVKSHGNGAPELPDLRVIQELLHHNGPIWAAKVSPDGQFLATCGQDSIVRVWAFVNTQAARQLEEKARDRRQDGEQGPRSIPAELGGRAVLVDTPYRMFSGHKNDVIDLAWSKANFLLSASIDRTVRLWHVSRQRCLRMFQHSDFVTAVAFHPIEDKYFLSGSFDKKLRLWNIPDHCVVEWAQTANVVTSVAFAPHGKMAVAGLYNGQCVFYQTENLKYHTQVDCRNRRGKNKKGRKVTGLQFSASGQHLLVTTNDSRVRLYDLDDYSPLCKYKGLANEELQIRAVFSEDGKYVTCGSEDQCAFVWPTSLDEGGGGVRKRKQHKIETYSYFKVGSTQSPTVSSCQFLPRATLKLTGDADNKQLLVTTEETGLIKIFECRKTV